MLETPRFSDIQTTDLVYYDADFEDACLSFCEQRDIDCLPCLTKSTLFFRKTITGFQEEDLTVDRLVDSQTQIFDPRMLERFDADPILFVTTNGYLSGVVHFSDYNKPVINTYLFNLISSYERALRKLLCLYDLSNDDMLYYFQSVLEDTKNGKEKRDAYSKLNGYKEDFNRNHKMPAFECFFLLDLIHLAGYRKIISVSLSTNSLRNSVMHAHEQVSLDDAYRGDFIYTFDSFEKFFNKVKALLEDYKKVNNKITLREFELSEKQVEKNTVSKRRPEFTKQAILDLLTIHGSIKEK